MAAIEEITQVDWCREAEQAFRSHPDTADDLENIRAEVQEESAQLLRFTGPAEMWLVTRLEQYPDGKRELVLVNAIGKNSRLVLSVCERAARRLKADSLRCHVRSRALMRILEAQGWQAGRTVYEKALSNV